MANLRTDTSIRTLALSSWVKFQSRADLLNACERNVTEVVKSLLQEEGIEIDVRDEYQRTPLHYACKYGNLEVAMALVDRGADVDVRDEDQPTDQPFRFPSFKIPMALPSFLNKQSIHCRGGDKNSVGELIQWEEGRSTPMYVHSIFLVT